MMNKRRKNWECNKVKGKREDEREKKELVWWEWKLCQYKVYDKLQWYQWLCRLRQYIMLQEDTTVRKDTKGYNSTNDTKGYDAYKSMIRRYEQYKGYEKGCENISMVTCRITMGIKYQKETGFDQWQRLREKKWIDGDGSDQQTWNKSKVKRIV